LREGGIARRLVKQIGLDEETDRQERGRGEVEVRGWT